ncbi:MAG: N-acetylmuramoyl-L-alanine amidase [Oscillibacter sp.]|nr:N-acetylmuramoyl-L-alanine amidase [Oscillibacter sp.]
MAKQERGLLLPRLLLLGFGAAAIFVLALCAVRRSALPENVGLPLSGPEAEAVIQRNSPMTAFVQLSPNADFPRRGEICKITIHHMAENLSLEGLGAAFAQEDRRASSNYAIDSQGRVALYVEENNRAWTSSSRENDQQAVTIEVANDETGGDWHVSDAAFDTLIALCADICLRNGIPSLEYTGGPEGSLTVHQMFNPNTECPGPYLLSRMEDIAAAVNARLAAE